MGVVKNSRKAPVNDFWEEVVSEIVLSGDIPADAFDGTPVLDIKPVYKEFSQKKK